MLLWRQAPTFRLHRNALIAMTLVGLVAFWMYPVAPPRMLPGYHDVIAIAVPAFTSVVETNGAAQYASLPSLHVAWAIWVAIAACAVVRRPILRAAVWVYPVATTADVLATANHYLLDVITAPAIVLLGYGLVLTPALIGRRAHRSSAPLPDPDPPPVRADATKPAGRAATADPALISGPTWPAHAWRATRGARPGRPGGARPGRAGCRTPRATRRRTPRPTRMRRLWSPSRRSEDQTMPTAQVADYLPGRLPAISAHRGGSEHAPAGTYAAYESALAGGAEYLEFDVRRTADGELVAFHDARAGRRQAVAAVTYAELCRLADYDVPTTSGLLQLLKGHAAAHIDLKDPDCLTGIMSQAQSLDAVRPA